MPSLTTATLGAGCFWCIEAVLRRLRGVEAIAPGYAGGHVPDPSYEAVCSGTTGHAEVVQVTFDPAVLPFDELLRVFFAFHDPTTRDRQGPDVGPQYRSAIFTTSPAQEDVARAVIAELEASGVFPAPIVTEVTPLDRFWPAEAHHHAYYERNADRPYCQAMITPKLAKLRARYAERLAPSA